MRPILLAVFLTLPAVLAGCMDDAGDASTDPNASVGSASDAGLTSGPAPSAPTEAYQVGDDSGAAATVHPVLLTTNPAKPPVNQTVAGTFEPTDCSPMGSVPGVSENFRLISLDDYLAPGDVFNYRITFTFENRDSSWAEIHPGMVIGTRNEFYSPSTGSARGPFSVTWEGQSFRASEEDPVFVFAACWYGTITMPIVWSATFDFTYGANAVPAETPFLIEIPPNATRLFVRGVPVVPEDGVLSHFRLFAPDDTQFCECALNSGEEAAVVALPPGGGQYVLIVDHTSNGFVSVGLDAPSPSLLTPLGNEWVLRPLLVSDGGAVDETVAVVLPKVPLGMFWWTRPAGGDPSVAMGRNVNVVLTNAHGEVMNGNQGSYFMVNGGGRQEFVPYDGENWDTALDHHAYAPGAHEAHIRAEQFRGEVMLFTREYVR